MLRRRVYVAAIAAVAAVAGCSQKHPSQAAQEAAVAPPPYYTQLPIKEFMAHVMQYAGDGVWQHSGTITNITGEHSLEPKTDEDWEKAESASRTLAEMTNVLLIPGRRIPEPKWDAAAVHVRTIALRAADAAEKHDIAGFTAASGELDGACDECHKHYDPSFTKPPPSPAT